MAAETEGDGIRHDVQNEISDHLDSLIQMCQAGNGDDLAQACIKFQVEHGADTAVYSLEAERCRKRGEEVSTDYGEQHLRVAMKRMVVFAGTAARIAFRRAAQRKFCMVRKPLAHSVSSGSSVGDSETRGPSPRSPTAVSNDGNEGDFPPVTYSAWGRSCSVEDCSEGTEGWVAIGAQVLHDGLRILSLIPLASARLKTEMQTYMVGDDVRFLDYLCEALATDRETELQCFAEGFRTQHLSVLCNATHDNPLVCRAAGAHPKLLPLLIASTRIDEENPGMGEWAEFAIRNICLHSAEARTFIKNLRVPSSTERRSGSPMRMPTPVSPQAHANAPTFKEVTM